jgi:enoyl-CoA hydratase
MPVTWEQKDKTAVVTIDNPPVNALDAEIIEALDRVFNELGQQADVYAVVLAGAGNKAFVAGADINRFIPLAGAGGYDLVRQGVDVFQKIADFPFPVICVVDGFALGGGLELALACDIRIVEEQARLGVPEIGLGIIPGYGGTQRLPRLVGPGIAKKMIFSGRPIKADEALRVGLAEQLVPTGEGLGAAMALAAVFTANAPVALRVAKDVMNKGMEMGSLVDAIRYESKGIRKVFDTEDKKEGVDAFLNKRKAVFQGK